METNANIDDITGESILREKFKSPLAAIPQAIDYDVSRTITFATNGVTGYIGVGIVDDKGNPDPDRIHESWNGEEVSYRTLFRALNNAGYDPLLPVRQEEYILKVVHPKIKIAINDCMKKVEHGKKPNIKLALRPVKNKIAKDILNYIIGSFKPPLEESTMRSRAYREEQDPTLYGAGYRTALFETGNLADAIDVKVVIIQSNIEKALYYYARGKVVPAVGKMIKESLRNGTTRRVAKQLTDVALASAYKKRKFSFDIAQKSASAKLFAAISAQWLKAKDRKRAAGTIKSLEEYEKHITDLVSRFGVIERMGNIFGMDYSSGVGKSIK